MARRGQRKVIVVGAGLAGLSAAYHLSRDPETEVTLLEARDRIGGRVHTDHVRGVEIDLGGFLVFPWYTRYRALCDELGISDELRKVPECRTYTDLGDRQLITERDLDLKLRDVVHVIAKSLPGAFLAGDLHHPKLDFYERRTIDECIDHWENDPTKAKIYKQLVDTICQGYCYAPIDEYKAAFAVPIYPQTLLRGAAQDSDLLRHGSDELPKALFDAYRRQGGSAELACEVTRVEPGRLQTSRGEREADAVIFAATADQPLFDDLLPTVTGRISYTRFVTAVVATNAPYHPEVGDWGAIFFAPRDDGRAQVLSMISLEKLYDTSELRSHYTVNVRVPAGAAHLSQDEIRSAVDELLPKGITVDTIPTVAEWPQAMPISSEAVVETVRALQGIGGRYFAGDFLGCPSMEVAVRTGIDAAEMVIAQAA